MKEADFIDELPTAQPAESRPPELQAGEDFFFEVPAHPANHLFAKLLKRKGFDRSNLLDHGETHRFYMPEGTDVKVILQEYAEYFDEGKAPEPTIIPLGHLTPGRSAKAGRGVQRDEPRLHWPPEN